MKKLRRVKFVCCLMLCVSLSACSKEGISDNDAIPGESTVSNITPVTQKQGWVYVPEMITVGDEHADYERMQPVGDTFCYVSRGEESGNGTKSICRYSLTDGTLKLIPVNWPEGGNDWDAGYKFFTQDYGLYMTANVYPASDAIASVSEHKESAWAFIEDSLTQKKSDLYAELWLTYPALKKTLAERVELAIARDRFTWDDVNVALKLVPDATPFFAVEDDEIIQIINEEAGAYYSGQKRIEDVVSIIQNRIQLYVNENT